MDFAAASCHHIQEICKTSQKSRSHHRYRLAIDCSIGSVTASNPVLLSEKANTEHQNLKTLAFIFPASPHFQFGGFQYLESNFCFRNIVFDVLQEIKNPALCLEIEQFITNVHATKMQLMHPLSHHASKSLAFYYAVFLSQNVDEMGITALSHHWIIFRSSSWNLQLSIFFHCMIAFPYSLTIVSVESNCFLLPSVTVSSFS